MQTAGGDRQVRFTFDATHAPVIHVSEGEIFRVETPTDDPYGALSAFRAGKPVVPTLTDRAREALGQVPPLANGVIGPIAVENCMPGDVLAVTIHSVEPGPLGYVSITPGGGPLHDSARYPDCRGPHVQVIEHVPGPSGTTRDGKARYSENVTWDLLPFIGTLATAPQREVVTSLYGQGSWGGNVDCREFRAGHTVLLNAYTAGGLLYVGDVHGGQGDTEFCGVADETTAVVELSCRVIKRTSLPNVRIVKPRSVVALGLNKPLEAAVHDAATNLMGWMQEGGASARDAYLRFSADPGFRIRIYQMLSGSPCQFVVGAEYPNDRGISF
jgi:acetamidase/formamidase